MNFTVLSIATDTHQTFFVFREDISVPIAKGDQASVQKQLARAINRQYRALTFLGAAVALVGLMWLYMIESLLGTGVPATVLCVAAFSFGVIGMVASREERKLLGALKTSRKEVNELAARD